MHAPSLAESQILIKAAIEIIVAASLGAARPAGMMLVLPVFTRTQIGGLIRGCLAVAFGLPCLAHISDGLRALGPETRLIQLALFGFKEAFVGVLLGILLAVPLWSLQAAGEIIDTQRGITSPVAPTDPATNNQSSATAVFLGITAVTIFVASGGLEAMIRCLYGSYLVWPVFGFRPTLTLQGAMEVFGLLDHIMYATLLVSGPVVCFLVLVDIAVMILGRFAPQFKSNHLSPTIKNISFPLVMITYTVYLIEGMKLEITWAKGALEWFNKLLR
ncbi:type III secretion protein T [Sinorhizobium terangae]|uniref:EscT/YscT/HrcT family type III secretion system export apparatus protein n=1 Tax=Sinorhizobium terangae TaxID=110322 RepID=A0A6N7LGE0_SINTE|nr:type III secretion system export apparatus subunit SctT [Sinorhizobium terangae]MBB4188993.1 type III secretion protein T [Sinorhizobium terangae]MQX16268.1 EscT/YscT/HrcT family type III secretion system export apparatus protein [Sinorhizobium terangae]